VSAIAKFFANVALLTNFPNL